MSKAQEDRLRRVTPESIGHQTGKPLRRCGILFDVTGPLARALGVKHVECDNCHERFALKIGESV